MSDYILSREADVLKGGGGADTLSGGLNSDVFVYEELATPFQEYISR